MASIVLDLPVPNAAELVRYYDRVMIFRARGGNLAAGWQEITTPQTRLPLLASVVSYEFVDNDGGTDDLYAAGYINSASLSVSPLGEAVSGAGDPTEQLISVDELKERYLFGLRLSFPNGGAMPDSLFRFWRQQAVAWVEAKTGVQLTTRVVRDEVHDLVRPNRRTQPVQICSNLIPAQSVQALRLELPYRRGARDIPLEWARLRPHSGRIYVYPQCNTYLGEGFGLSLGIAGPGSAYGWSAIEDLVPASWHLDYVAGFRPGEVPADLLDLVGKAASLAPLMIAGDLYGKPGTVSRSLGIDGLSQSTGLVRNAQGGVFGARVAAYQAEMAAQGAALRTRYRGIPLKGM